MDVAIREGRAVAAGNLEVKISRSDSSALGQIFKGYQPPKEADKHLVGFVRAPQPKPPDSC